MKDNAITVNKSGSFVLRANGDTTGISDWVVVLVDPTNAVSSISTTVTEINNGTYRVAFTPDVVGTWEIRATSASNGDSYKISFDVKAKDESDLSSEVSDVQNTADSIETKVDNISNNLGGGGFI